MPDEAAILAGRIVPGMSFAEKVWALTARIPEGEVTTYGAIAQALGSKGYQAVGQALRRTPFATRLPCHRVVGRDGSLSGYGRGRSNRIRLLKREGIAVRAGKVHVDEFYTSEDLLRSVALGT
jgi:methylated-DNA-[protein]-cysteine S-methyltransferase